MSIGVVDIGEMLMALESSDSIGPCEGSNDGSYCLRNCVQDSNTPAAICAEECPAGQGADEEGICEDCTGDTPFADIGRHSCVPVCPSGAAPAGGNETATARSCVMCSQTTNSDDESTPFADHGGNQCVKECPDGTVGNAARDCVSLCPNDGEFFDGMVDDSTTYANCVSTCAPGKVPDRNKVCGWCRGTTNETGHATPYRLDCTHCGSRCPAGQAPDVNNECTDCQDPTPYSHQNRSIHKCVARCDAGHVGNSTTAACQQCAQDTAEPPRWIEWADHQMNKCVDSCPDGTSEADSGDCEPMCSMDEAFDKGQEEGKCVPKGACSSSNKVPDENRVCP